MIEKIKEIFRKSNSGYKAYNMIIDAKTITCTNSRHESTCNCSCHSHPGTLHIVACCHQEVCPDCKKEINVKKKY